MFEVKVLNSTGVRKGFRKGSCKERQNLILFKESRKQDSQKHIPHVRYEVENSVIWITVIAEQ